MSQRKHIISPIDHFNPNLKFTIVIPLKEVTKKFFLWDQFTPVECFLAKFACVRSEIPFVHVESLPEFGLVLPNLVPRAFYHIGTETTKGPGDGVDALHHAYELLAASCHL